MMRSVLYDMCVCCMMCCTTCGVVCYMICSVLYDMMYSVCVCYVYCDVWGGFDPSAALPPIGAAHLNFKLLRITLR